MRFDAFANDVGIRTIHKGTGIPVSTLYRLRNDPQSGNIETIAKIVAFSRRHPASTGETVRYEDFAPSIEAA